MKLALSEIPKTGFLTTGVRILSPHADTQATSLLVEDFLTQFPGRSLPVELAEFSFPTQLRETQNIHLGRFHLFFFLNFKL